MKLATARRLLRPILPLKLSLKKLKPVLQLANLILEAIYKIIARMAPSCTALALSAIATVKIIAMTAMVKAAAMTVALETKAVTVILAMVNFVVNAKPAMAMAMAVGAVMTAILVVAVKVVAVMTAAAVVAVGAMTVAVMVDEAAMAAMATLAMANFVVKTVVATTAATHANAKKMNQQ